MYLISEFVMCIGQKVNRGVSSIVFNCKSLYMTINMIHVGLEITCNNLYLHRLYHGKPRCDLIDYDTMVSQEVTQLMLANNDGIKSREVEKMFEDFEIKFKNKISIFQLNNDLNCLVFSLVSTDRGFGFPITLYSDNIRPKHELKTQISSDSETSNRHEQVTTLSYCVKYP